MHSFKDIALEIVEKSITVCMQFMWLALIGIFAGLVVMTPILIVALVYWVACLITGAIFTWIVPIAIGVLFLVTLGLAWYEGDGM